MHLDPEQIKQAKEKLPEAVQEILDSEEVATSIFEIGKKYQLHVDQIGNLAVITRLYLMGLVSPTDFDSTLIKETGISTDVANLITYELNQKIFLKIKAIMIDRPENKTITTDKKNQDDSELYAMTENSKTGKQSSPNILTQKMSSDFGLSKEKVDLSSNTLNSTDQPQPVPPHKDPYREPIE